MRTIKLKSGKLLYVTGPLPVNKGDRFEATDVLPAPPSPSFGAILGGQGHYFSCRRGHAGAPARTFVYDPDKHELEPA